MLCARNPYRENSNYWEALPEEAGGFIPKGSRIKKKNPADQQAAETTGDHKRDLETCDTGKGQQLTQLGISLMMMMMMMFVDIYVAFD